MKKLTAVTVVMLMLGGCGQQADINISPTERCAKAVEALTSGGDKKDMERECNSLKESEQRAAINLAAQRNSSVTLAPQAPSLGLSPDVFKERFNQIAEEIDAPFHINQMKIDKGNVDSFNVKFSKNNVLFGTITKDGMIDSVTSISSGDGTIQSGLKMMLLSAIIVRSTSPDLSKEDAGKVVLEMMGKNNKSPDATSHSKKIGNVEYFTSLSKDLGYWFGVQVPSKK